MEDEFVIALELLRDARFEIGLGIKPRHFVLVLDGEELEVIPGYGFAQGRRAGQLGGFGRTHPGDQLGVALGVRGVLVGGQEGFAPIDDLLERLRQALRLRLSVGNGRRRDARRVHRCKPAPVKALLVGIDRRTVQLDGTQDGRLAHRQQAALIRESHHEKIGGNGIAHESGREFGGIQELRFAGADGVLDFTLHRSQRKREIGVARKAGRHHQRRVDERLGDTLLHLGELLVPDAGQDVARQHQLRLARGNARGMQCFRRVGNANMRHHRTILLRQPGHVQHAAALAFEMGRHAEQGADGDHAGAPDAGDHDAIGIGGRRERGLRQCREFTGFRFLGSAQAAAFHRDKARAKPVDARVILVA